MARLAYTVHVRVPDTGLHEVFLRGTELPEWAAPLVGDHVYEPGEAPEPEPEPEPEQDEDVDPEPDPEPESVDDKPKAPARNASAPAWREYAERAFGADPEDLARLTRNQLRVKYGK